ncbi:MAG: AAA family ATPase [Prevotellaceae bacterium]|jgi:AAA15 family ATPase/GTPase|nr:AAA family ATPase [Prevotellaceae bacterium]
MKIHRIKIKNFRSIQQAEFQTTDFNIFVGQNNCGKTNFFEALEFFFNGLGKYTNINDLKYGRYDKNEILVETDGLLS